jgi:hypothetical protein
MSRSLSASLITAIGESTRVPTVAMSIEDHIAHYPTYQTPGASSMFHDACLANDGSIVRVRVTRGGTGFNQNFQFQRVSDPTQAAQWTTWTTFSGGSGNCFQDGLCCVSNNGGTLRAFVLSGTTNGLWVWSSTNGGVSWSASPATVLTFSSGILLKGIASAGNNDVFFIYDVVGGEAIGCSFFSGSWSALSTWTLATMSSGAGLGVYWTGTNYAIVYSAGYALKQCTFNPGTSVWSALPDIASVTTTAIARISPRLTYDASVGLYTLACTEADSGLLTGSVYSYPRVRQSADLVHWSNGVVMHNVNELYGSVVLYRPGDATYLINMGTIARSPIYSQANATQYLDVSGALLSYERQEQAGKAARIEVVLDNNAGVLSNKVGSDTSYQPINLNCSVVLREGYKTGALHTTIERIKTGTYRIQQIVFERAPEKNSIRLVGYDLSRNLDALNRYQVSYSFQTVAWLVAEICARAGLFNPVVPATSATGQQITSFVLQAGQTYRRALDDLCATYHLAYFLDQDEVMRFRELSPSDTPVWSYQPEVERVTFGANDARANHIVVTGKPPVGGQTGALTSAEVHDDDHAHQVGLELLRHHVDPKLTSTAQCLLKAQFLLAQEQRAGEIREVVVPLNPGLQLLDVVTVNDYAPPTGSGQGGNARILETSARYDAQEATYQHTLHLEGV